jgi:hypothetical protein
MIELSIAPLFFFALEEMLGTRPCRHEFDAAASCPEVLSSL